MTRPPINPPAKLHSAAAQADRDRADLLLGISEGVLTLADAIEQAARDRAIRRLSLRQVLLELDGIGDAAVRRIESRYHVVLGSTAADRDRRLLLVHIVDARHGGRGIQALADAVARERKLLPSGRRALVRRGFPFAALPTSPRPTTTRPTTDAWGEPLPQPPIKPAPSPWDQVPSAEPATAPTEAQAANSTSYSSIAEARESLGIWSADMTDADLVALVEDGEVTR
ncbi:hypothetical protein [Leifsonia sp. Leaf264]|uniref:hypothetical protein n=1 Tax=Leifsonia sp. Leaf264 TaxID=1736314 RepID=UPI0006FA25D5|nr:hypothetical protein [Leifsonia sp. Leaf264]KQP01431.1 hypothetical protein ASF30_02095 [Leifsonia sp. Leaf264]